MFYYDYTVIVIYVFNIRHSNINYFVLIFSVFLPFGSYNKK